MFDRWYAGLLLKAPIQPGNFNDSNELTRETTVKFVNRTYTWLSARVLILRVDTHFFSPGFISTSTKKHLRGEREKERKKKEQFSQHVSQEGTNCNLKIQHLFSSLSDCYNLSIILSVFKLQEKNTRKEKRRGTRSYLFLDPGLDCKDCRNTLERNKMVGQRQPWLPREVMAEESR